MTLLLAGDIGGTKTILRLVKASSDGTTLQALYEAVYPSRNFPDLVPIVYQFLATAAEQMGEQLLPQKACFAIAGPVVNNTAKLTNLVWSLDTKRMEQQLSIASITLINDFAAVGYGVLGLDAKDLHTLQTGNPQVMPPSQ